MNEGRPRAEPKRRAVVEALVKESNPTKVVAYFCTHCGTVYSDKNGSGKENAERCTVNNRQARFDRERKWREVAAVEPCTDWVCEKCGGECSDYQWYCERCRSRHQASCEEKRLATAEVVPNYPYNQGVYWNDSYFDCIDTFIDFCEMEGIEVPDRVWATERIPFELDADDILESAFEDWSEGCADVDDKYCGEDEFKAAVAAFNEANDDKVLFFESNKAVDLVGYRNKPF